MTTSTYVGGREVALVQARARDARAAARHLAENLLPLPDDGARALAIAFKLLGNAVYLSWTAKELADAQLAGRAFRDALRPQLRLLGRVSAAQGGMWNSMSRRTRECLRWTLDSWGNDAGPLELNLCGFSPTEDLCAVTRGLPAVQTLLLGVLSDDSGMPDIFPQTVFVPARWARLEPVCWRARAFNTWIEGGECPWQALGFDEDEALRFAVPTPEMWEHALSAQPRGLLLNFVSDSAGMGAMRVVRNAAGDYVFPLPARSVPTLDVLVCRDIWSCFDGIGYGFGPPVHLRSKMQYWLAAVQWLSTWLEINPSIKHVILTCAPGVRRFYEWEVLTEREIQQFADIALNPVPERRILRFGRVYGETNADRELHMEVMRVWQSIKDLVASRAIAFSSTRTHYFPLGRISGKLGVRA